MPVQNISIHHRSYSSDNETSDSWEKLERSPQSPQLNPDELAAERRKLTAQLHEAAELKRLEDEQQSIISQLQQVKMSGPSHRSRDVCLVPTTSTGLVIPRIK